MKTHIIDITSYKAIIPGPGIRLILDASEIIPNDPGAGTPAVVAAGRYSGTFWCAADTGELDCGEYQLNPRQIEWLDDQFATVTEWHRYHLDRFARAC